MVADVRGKIGIGWHGRPRAWLSRPRGSHEEQGVRVHGKGFSQQWVRGEEEKNAGGDQAWSTDIEKKTACMLFAWAGSGVRSGEESVPTGFNAVNITIAFVDCLRQKQGLRCVPMESDANQSVDLVIQVYQILFPLAKSCPSL